MDEILIREVLVFGSAVGAAVWGYYLRKVIERRRFDAEVDASLEAIERWAINVCGDLDDLERSLAGLGGLTASGVSARILQGLVRRRARRDREVPHRTITDFLQLQQEAGRVARDMEWARYWRAHPR